MPSSIPHLRECPYHISVNALKSQLSSDALSITP
jgi:hypothetical protein